MPNPIRFNSLPFKLGVLVALLLLSTLPRFYVDSLIEDRQRYGEEAARSVVKGWAARHEIGNIELEFPSSSADAKALLHPEELSIQYTDQIEYRHRGLFKVPIYKADVTLTGHFSIPRQLETSSGSEPLTAPPRKFRMNLPASGSALTDAQFELAGHTVVPKRVDDGLVVPLAGENTVKELEPGAKLPFKLRLQLNGYGGFDIRTIATKLDVTMASRWPHPSFTDLLPSDLELGDTGFKARWKIHQAQSKQSLSIGFVDPMNVYTGANRALKYGFLITLLCLSVLFLMETLTGLRIHPMQYLLMTLPLSLFYVLLLAFAEQIGFGAAYAIASAAVVGLLGIYFSGIGAPRKQSALFSSALALVYALVYTILGSEDFALLIGAITLFVFLAGLMLGTRKVDWSKSFVRNGDSDELAKAAPRGG